jgi:hypothetical protein
MAAANKLYQAFQNGGHSDDWEIKRKCDRSSCRRCYKAYTMVLDTVGWHDRTTADHQQQLNTWQRDAIRRFR